jgi:hypothetical protein
MQTAYGMQRYKHGENFCVEHKETQLRRRQQRNRRSGEKEHRWRQSPLRFR